MKIIYGITDLAEKLYYMLRQSRIKVDAFTVNQKYMVQDKKEGIPVIPYEKLVVNAAGCEVYIAIGYNQMNRGRERIYEEVKKRGFKVASFIHPSAIVSTAQIGEGTLIFEDVVIGPYAYLGLCNICYPKSLIAHHAQIGDFNFFAISSSVAGNVMMGNRCFLGNSSFTKDGIEIADETLLGAGAYASENTGRGDCIVPARSVVLGNYKSIDLM